jgi:GNAT superfamily N-acetyltransferase
MMCHTISVCKSEGNSVSVTVRSAKVPDAGEIARVHVQSWRGAYRGLLPDQILDDLSIPGRTGQWTEWLAPGGPRENTLVALGPDGVLGFATLLIPSRDAEEPDDVGEIPAIYVDPSAWGDGAGHALLEASVAALRAAGCREGILWMLDGNDRAEAFYRAHGWSDDGGRRGSQHWPGLEDFAGAADLVEVRFRLALSA